MTTMSAAQCRLEDLKAIVETTTDRGDYPLADDLHAELVIYDAANLRRRRAQEPDVDDALMAELARALLVGPGIVVFRHAFAGSVVDATTPIFQSIIDEERERGGDAGDHFAAAGANDRVWNALEKLALRNPAAFVDYYSNDLLALVSLAWLGPGYQLTSQINVVNPGGQAQEPHRDYHLGFMGTALAERYPAHAHRLSPVLTLQGAVAHCDMAPETGPTMYLPHSHKYEAGYLAWRRPEFKQYFADNHVQIALDKGDAAFFNPAVFHGAGHNRTTSVRRMGNLLQISSAMGRAMERVDRAAMSRALYPALRQAAADGRSLDDIHRVIAASAEGYPFPGSLDHDQPVDGLMPASQADLMARALAEHWPEDRLATELVEQAKTRAA